jgi:SET domain-containing protein
MKSKPAVRKAAERAIDESVAEYRLLIRRSRIDGLGVFAAETIPARRKVIEYTGKRITGQQMARRIRHILKRRGSLPRYVFRLDRYWRIDGEIGGSGAERINHSCDPNLAARRVHGRILFFSVRRIPTGEELTLDYKYRPKGPRVICKCGSDKCRGTVNLISKD